MIDEKVLSDTKENTPALKAGDEIIEFDGNFELDDFQVVRREFFAHIREPSIYFYDYKMFINAACLGKFPNANYAKVLVNSEKKILALEPCEESARDSFLWCNDSNGKRKARTMSCKLLFAKLFALMDWNPHHKYKMLGKLIHSNDKYLLAFDLTATEVYQKNITNDKAKLSRTPVFPADWQDQFGLPYNEHKQTMQINIFDGYAVYSVKDTSATESSTVAQLPVTTEQVADVGVKDESDK